MRDIFELKNKIWLGTVIVYFIDELTTIRCIYTRKISVSCLFWDLCTYFNSPVLINSSFIIEKHGYVESGRYDNCFESGYH